MKKFIKTVTSSKFMLAVTFLINVTTFVVLTLFFNAYTYIYIASAAAAAILLIGLLNYNNEFSEYKFLWAIVIIILPFFGSALYIQMKTYHGNRFQRKRFNNVNYLSYKNLVQSNDVLEELIKFDDSSALYSKYMLNSEKWPVYDNTSATYIKDGETYFKELIEEIKKAKKYILLEYYILSPGKVWEELFNALRIKAREGVEIKLIYDDFGCINKFSDKKFFQKLANHGIESITFNRIVPFMNSFCQYRDHRKLAVIDGKVGFIGGINIGDEYANVQEKFGHWKDTAIKLEGSAVWSMTVMFFNNWQVTTKKIIDVTKYKASISRDNKENEYIQPYATGPITNEPVARNLFSKLVSGARKSIYITSPYFIVDRNILHDIKLAAKSGVDINIIMPGIPAKKWVFYLSRSYYAELIKSGVKIFEYSPGFIHAKMMLVDNTTAVMGSTNVDFRSMYLHFESGVIINNSKCITEMKQDMDSLIGSSHVITLRDMRQRKFSEKFSALFLKLFAPLI